MPRNKRRLSRRSFPILHISEDTALATADTVANVTLYNPPLATTELELTSTFHLRSARVTIVPGATSTRVLAIIRKVPQGYSFPTITVATGISTFIDFDNILAYGVISVTGTIGDPMARIDLRTLKRSIKINPGDTVGLQVVTNVSSANQTFLSECEYNISFN